MKKRAENKVTKTKILKNFCFAMKKIYKIDKSFIINKTIISIFDAVSSFMYAYILKVAIQALEEKVEFSELVIRVLLIIAIVYPIALYQRIVRPWLSQREERIYSLLHLEKSLRTLDMDYELLERPETQDVLEKASRRLQSWGSIQGLINRGFRVIQGAITFLIACGIILSMNGWLIIIICTLAIGKLVIENRNRVLEKAKLHDVTPPIWRRINYTNAISTNLDIGKDLRIYNMDKFINQERRKAIDEMLNLDKKNRIRNFIFQTIIAFLNLLDTAFLYGFLVYAVIKNNMAISMFSFMLSSVYTMVSALNLVITERGYLLQCSLEADDYLKFMNMEYIKEGDEQKKIYEIEEVEFRNVYYSYYMQEGYALENVSFKLKKGEKLALVGYNGAGKTTIVKLLTGLYHTTKGNIYINNIDINEISRASLSQVISPVFQEASLYSLSIAENIAMAYSLRVDHEKINSIIKTVGLDEKIASLPEQEKTMLTRDFDEKGINLSGGESQKLSLARSIYKEAFLYILDEPTSAMDAFSEYNMYKNFNTMVRGNATIYISHRLSSTKFCDRIIFISQGKIIENGTHDELMKKDTEYKKLFTMQAEYYISGDNNEK